MAYPGGWCLGALLLSGLATAQSLPTRVVATNTVAHETGDVRLPRFSPDSRTLAYAADLSRNGPALSEIRVISLADGRRRTLLDSREAQGSAAYSAYAVSLDWLDADHLVASLSDGDVGYTEFRLDRRRAGSLAETYVESDQSGAAPPADEAVVAILADWKRAALDAAVAGALTVEGRGMLLQKAYAGEDRHVWWLDTQAASARILVPEDKGEIAELRGGFAFEGKLLFALRQGAAVRVFRLDEAGELTQVPGAGSEAIPGGARLANAFTTSVGSLELRRCGPDACWARLHLRNQDWTQVQVLRLDRDGSVEIVDGLDGLEDFDLSPDLRHLAATKRNGDRRPLVLYRVTAF